jgi:hypothetical protein
MAFVPEGRCDRSLARSAWDRATQKSRPAGYGLIRTGMPTDSAHIFDQKDPWEVWDCDARSDRTLRDGSLAGRFPRGARAIRNALLQGKAR